MKTPDEIKKGLECCGSNGANADACPYMKHGSCWDCFDASSAYMNIMQDALAYIQQLESDNARLREKDTPKPCEHKATLYKCLTCPSCGNVVSQHEMWGETEVRILPKYCKFCGQRIEYPKEGPDEND